MVLRVQMCTVLVAVVVLNIMLTVVVFLTSKFYLEHDVHFPPLELCIVQFVGATIIFLGDIGRIVLDGTGRSRILGGAGRGALDGTG